MREPQKPEYRRKQERAAKERQEAEKHNDNVNIIAALNRVADGQNAANDENSPKQKGKRSRELTTIVGIYLAATVALVAVLVTHKDSSDQIGALSGQLKVMQSQLNAMAFDQRPWLSLDVSAGGPLLHDANGSNSGLRWHLPLNYRIKNLGKTPATNVAFFAHIVPVVTGIGGISIPGELDRACQFWEQMQAIGIGISELVFPLEEWPEKKFQVSGNERDFEAAKTVDGVNLKYLGQFLVTACVVYRPSFAVEAPYRTAKEYYVGARHGPIDLNSVGIDAADVAFGPNRTRGTLAR